MKRAGFNSLTALLAVLLLALARIHAATPDGAPEFREVYELLQSHLTGVNSQELNSAAVEGLLEQFPGRVSIGSGSPGDTNTPMLAEVRAFDDGVAYVRVRRVASGLADKLAATWSEMGATNSLKGLVLDLRFAGGDDFQAAAATADLFAAKERVLLDWGEGVARSTAKTNAIAAPVAVLVNERTSSAAEALAAVLRETGTGLIIGGKTSGSAMVTREFPLKTGQTLRIAASPVKLADGTELTTGVKPDIEVAVSLQEERAYLEDPYSAPAETNSMESLVSQDGDTNRPARRNRPSEADLVREHRRGNTNDLLQPPLAPKPDRPVIADPALSRAVDLVKGLALVRGSRS
jgi:hypothetical protein